MTSTMKNKLSDLLVHRIIPIVILLSMWEIAALIYNKPYFLPGLFDTFLALIRIIQTNDFLLIIILTLLRIFAGILLGTLTAVLLALASYKVKFIHSLLSPLNSVIKATPVASIIILLWVSMNGNSLAIFVSFMMVFPIIWQNIYDAFSSIDNELIEVSRVYGFSLKKRMKILILPALKQYFIPAFVTAIGLAFKAEIAAEIIAGVRNSIGQMIYYAKDAPKIDEMFAWTVIGVFLSMLIEWLARLILMPKKNKRAEVTV